MNKTNYLVAGVFAVAFLLLTSCSTMQAKKPVFKGTKWVCVQQEFVADAGTMTETYTLEFTSAKDCIWKDSWVLPAHPAMYMNSDGTVDTIPASGSESVAPASWKYSRGKLTLTFDDGSTRELLYEKGKLVGEGSFVGPLVFEKIVE